MQEFLKDIFLAVVTAAVPVLTAYIIVFIRNVGENAAAKTEDTKAQGYIREIASAVSEAVAATSQTYVDALKKAGNFTKEAQEKAAKKAMEACLVSLSRDAKDYIMETYRDLGEYLNTRIEAEVRSQKLGFSTLAS